MKQKKPRRIKKLVWVGVLVLVFSFGLSMLGSSSRVSAGSNSETYYYLPSSKGGEPSITCHSSNSDCTTVWVYDSKTSTSTNAVFDCSNSLLPSACKNNTITVPFASQGTGTLSSNGTTQAISITNPNNVTLTPPGGDTECGSGNSKLGWIICPIYDMVKDFADKFNNLITQLLQINSCNIFGSGSDCTSVSPKTSTAYRGAWSSMRNIALIIVVVTGLIMIVAQAVGSQAIDAYTIKSVMPRLLIAAIFIALSWIVLQFFVDLSNVLGEGVRQLIYAPFNGLASGGGSPGAINDIGVLSGVGAIGLVTGIIAGASIGTLLMAALSLAIAMIVGLLVIILRNLLVVFLIIVSPVAIALYVLPNTKKGFTMWWDSFIKALMMFPIIIAFIAVGRVFSLVALVQGQTAGSGSILYGIIAIVAYIIPLFLLPFTFKMAGGAMGAIGQGLTQLSSKARAPIKKRMKETMAGNRTRLGAGERFNNRTLNAVSARATTRNLGLGKRGRAAYDEKMAIAAGRFAQSEKAKTIQFKDNVNRALTYGSAAEAKARMAADWGITDKEEIDKAIEGAKQSGGFGRNRQVWAAKQLAATGTGYDSSAQFYSTIARVAGNNDELADSIYGEARGLSERAGRNDLKSMYTPGTQFLAKIRKDGNSYMGTGQIQAQYGDDMADLGLDAARGIENMSAMRNKPKAVANMMADLERAENYHRGIITSTDPAVTPEIRRKAAVRAGQARAKRENLATYSGAGYGSEMVAEAVQGQRIGASGGGLTGERRPGVGEPLPPEYAALEEQAHNEEIFAPPRSDPRLRDVDGPGGGAAEPPPE